MQASPSKPRFLLDENVKKRLLLFLASKGFDAAFAPKGTKNGRLAELCKSGRMVLVTNDTDFTNQESFNSEKLYSAIWLTIPQDDTEALLDSFSVLLEAKPKPGDFEGKLIVLSSGKFVEFQLPSKKKPQPKSPLPQ